MAMPALKSMTSPSQTNNNPLRDVSFTSYLNGAEDSFVCKLTGPSLDHIPKVAVQQDHLLGRKKAEDGEIGVFSAEKYFTGAMDESSPKISSMTSRKYESKKDEQKDTVPGNIKVRGGAPSIITESSIISESSWNSQSSLLQAILRNQSRRKTDKVKGKSFLAGLGCKCSCSDKDSVDVRDHAGEISFNRTPDAIVLQGNSITEQQVKTSLKLELKTLSGSMADELGNGLDKETCFTFPITNSGLGNVLEQQELIPRKSLEVFGSPINDKRSKSFHLEPRSAMLSWDANPRAEEFQFPATPGGGYNDNESDASSDLFEIESLSGKAIPFPARISDATSDCATPTTCYAPSEASIEWSVVTASAADFSVVSDHEELRQPAAALCPVKELTANAKSRTDVPKRRPSILLGCKSLEAVKVVGDAHIKNDKNFDPRMHRVSDSYMPRFRAETKQAELKSSRSKIALANHSLPRSHSHHNSHLL